MLFHQISPSCSSLLHWLLVVPRLLSFLDTFDSCIESFVFQMNYPNLYSLVLSRILDFSAMLIQSRRDSIIVENSIRGINENPEGVVL